MREFHAWIGLSNSAYEADEGAVAIAVAKIREMASLFDGLSVRLDVMTSTESAFCHRIGESTRI